MDGSQATNAHLHFDHVPRYRHSYEEDQTQSPRSRADKHTSDMYKHHYRLSNDSYDARPRADSAYSTPNTSRTPSLVSSPTSYSTFQLPVRSMVSKPTQDPLPFLPHPAATNTHRAVLSTQSTPVSPVISPLIIQGPRKAMDLPRRSADLSSLSRTRTNSTPAAATAADSQRVYSAMTEGFMHLNPRRSADLFGHRHSSSSMSAEVALEMRMFRD